MKATQLIKKVKSIGSQMEQQIEKLADLAEEFDDEELSELMDELIDKLNCLVTTGENFRVTIPEVIDYIENELMNKE